MTTVLPASADDVVGHVAALLRSGGVAVIPTDTVYGLAAAADQAEAVQRLFALKGREATVPVAVLCADAEQALALAEPSSVARRLAEQHWPGPLTIVAERRAGLGWALGEPADTIGVRCPDHDLVRAVAARIGPLATTSANRHGLPTPDMAVDAARSLTGPVDLVVDGGALAGTPSTVVDCTGGGLRVLRQGSIEVDLEGGGTGRSTTT